MSGRRYRAPRRADLSQHFLRSRALASSLVAQACISSDDLVFEIGPGRGVLTDELARRCRKLVGVEIDERLCHELRERFGNDPHVSIVHKDFMRVGLPAAPYKVFGNIPYSRTAAFVRRLVDAPSPPDDAYLVVQREAAERFAGGPYAPETLPSLLLKPWWQIEIVRRLRRTDFDPPPRVDSVVLWFARRKRPLVAPSQGARYRRFVNASFGRSGSTVGRCIGVEFTRGQIRRLSDDLRFDPSTPSSDLTFEQWLGLFRFLALKRMGGV